MLPAVYEFPPFFTRQINVDTWQAQKRHWQQVIAQWCRSVKQYEISRTSPVFSNERIHRTLPPTVADEIMNSLVDLGLAERIGGGAIHVYSQPPSEMAAAIRSWATSRGQSGTIVTLYELAEEDTPGLDICSGADDIGLKRAAELLEKQGYATLLKEDGGIVGMKLH